MDGINPRKRAYATPGIFSEKINLALCAAGYGAICYSVNEIKYRRVRDGQESVVCVPGQRTAKRRWSYAQWKRFVERYGLNIYSVGNVLHMEATKSG